MPYPVGRYRTCWPRAPGGRHCRAALPGQHRPHDHHPRYLQKATEHIENTMWELMSEYTSENGGKRKIPVGMWEKKWKEICPQQMNIQQLPGQGPISVFGWHTQ